MKLNFLLLSIFTALQLNAQELPPSQQFWSQLQTLCGKSFEGKLITPENDAQFAGKTLIMHVRSCSDTVIKIPFFVGDDKSRTWVLTYTNGLIELKHDHRHEDGTNDAVTMYGGMATNTGKANLQMFPADAYTATLIPAAATNVWWIGLNDNTFTYNLKRVDTPRQFTVAFDLSTAVENPGPPWGWPED